MRVDISSEAVERAIAMAGLHGLHGTQATLRAQAERIKELEGRQASIQQLRVFYRNVALRAVKLARNDALRNAHKRIEEARETYCLALPGTDEEFAAALSGIDMALSLLKGDRP